MITVEEELTAWRKKHDEDHFAKEVSSFIERLARGEAKEPEATLQALRANCMQISALHGWVAPVKTLLEKQGRLGSLQDTKIDNYLVLGRLLWPAAARHDVRLIQVILQHADNYSVDLHEIIPKTNESYIDSAVRMAKETKGDERVLRLLQTAAASRPRQYYTGEAEYQPALQ